MHHLRADECKAVIVQFGGQGSAYMNELAHLVASFQSVHDLVSRAEATFQQTVPTEAPRIQPLLWATEPSTRPSDYELLYARVSYPLVFLTQLATYIAFLESMELTHQLFLPRIQGGTGHSQGVVAAVLLATASTQEELEDLGLRFLQLMYHHGCHAQAAFDSVGDTEASNATPMLLVRGWTESTLASIVADFNRQTMHHHPPVQISLVNDTTSIVVTGLPTALSRLCATLEGKAHHRDAMFRVEFLPVSCPFHNDMLSGAQSVIEADATRLGLVVPGNSLRFPVIGTTPDASNLKSHRHQDIVPDLIRMQLSDTMDWPSVSAAAASLVGTDKCTVLDFGPGRPAALALHPQCRRVRVIDALSSSTGHDPMSSRECQVAAIWAALLNVNVAEIGRKTSFFALGGDSVVAFQAVAACKSIGVILTVAQFLRDPTVREVVKAATSSHSSSAIAWPRGGVVPFKAVSASDERTAYPVTPSQAGMLLATLSNSSAYVLQATLRLARPSSQAAALVSAFQSVVQANEILQTTFAATDAGMVQLFPTTALPAASAVAHESLVDLPEFLELDFARGFTLDDSSFVRLTMLAPQSETSECFGVLTIHHAIIDGWSLNALLTDLLDGMANEAVLARPAFRTVVDYVEGQDKVATKCFWTAYLDGYAPTPVGVATPKLVDESAGDSLALTCSVRFPRLARVAAAWGVTPSDLSTLAWAATLRKFTRQDDVAFGQVRSNRGIPVDGADRILGPLLNTVPCRVVFDDTEPLTQLLQRLHTSTQAMTAYAHASAVDIAKWIDLSQPLFDTLFSFQQWPPRRTMDGVDVLETWKERYGKSQLAQHYAFELQVEPTPTDDLVAIASYLPDRLSWAQARAMLDEFDYTLTQLCSAPSTSSALWALSPAQTAAMDRASFGPELAQPYELLHHPFEARALEHPDLRAVECDGRWLTYGELNALANSVACDLAALGVDVGCRVAIVMSRCLEFPIGLLATLKVGAAMMPLDVAFPAKRVDMMLADAGVTVVVSTKRHEHEIEALALDSLSVVNVQIEKEGAQGKTFVPSDRHVAAPKSEAYIVYTSGSTGQPKGVPVLHRGAVNSIQQHADLLHVQTGTRLFQMMAIGFDGFQADMWQCLSFGGTLVLRSETDLADLHTVDNITCTPTALSLLGDPQLYPRLKVVAVAGEACPTTLRDLWAPHARFLNLYGPSECAIMSHASPLTKDGPITIGSVIANVNCYVLDDHQRRVPMGVAGEFYLGGVGVSPGYINLPELTQDRFVSDPFARHQGMMYRTGDVGRVLPSGAFEIMGRMDSQVKLKGYRVELDEVANVMMLHPDVASACVVVKDKSHLVGFFTPQHTCKKGLEEFALGLLPAYMVPTVWVGLDVMPTNVNGKIDRSALDLVPLDTAVVRNETDVEHVLAAVWSDVLGVQVHEIGRTTSFIALGGDSISAIRVSAKMKHHGWTLSTAHVIKFARLESMARAAVPLATAPVSSDAVVSGAVPLTPIQHMSFRHPWRNVHHWNLSMTLKARRHVTADALQAAVSKLAVHHDMLRARFEFDGVEWKQFVLAEAPSPTVKSVHLGHLDDLSAAILVQEQSLHLTSGPVYAVTLFTTPDMDQFVQFSLHHAIADMVSWRILAHDLQTVLLKRSLDSKTTSFKRWSEEMSRQAPLLSPTKWAEYMGLDVAPPTALSSEVHRQQFTLQPHVADKLSAANATYDTNIQEMALTALTGALAQVRDVDSAQLLLMMEGHGREPWESSLDVSSTVGWFTCEFPVVFTSTADLSALIRHVKQTLRGVPDKGLSYEAIKYLVPPSLENAAIQAHRRHNLAFNYLGRFQELKARDSLFDFYDEVSIPQTDSFEASFTPGSVSLHHHGGTLVLTMDIPDWLFQASEVDAWGRSWLCSMEQLVDHCLDPATIGGRTLSDVPLLKSPGVVQAVEEAMLTTLRLRPLDVADVYPVTSLQAGFLTAMIQDPSEYVLQTVLDVRGVGDFDCLRSSWAELVSTTPFLSTVFGSTIHGLFQAIAKDDWTSWRVHDRVLSANEWTDFLAPYLRVDREEGFSLASKSFHRFHGIHLDDGSMRLMWTTHHAVMDGWSLPLLMDRWLAILNGGGAPGSAVKPFRDHVEWLEHRDLEECQVFWREALANADKTQLLSLPKPVDAAAEPKYNDLHRTVDLVHLKQLCQQLSVTPSTVFRTAWAMLLHTYTRSDHVVFGAVVSGRDNGEPDVERMIGMLINTVPVLAQITSATTVAALLAGMQTYSTDMVGHSHASLVDIKRWTGLHRVLFDTLVAFENYPQTTLDSSNVPSVTMDIASRHEFADTTLGIAVSPLCDDSFGICMTYNSSQVHSTVAQCLFDRLVKIVAAISDPINSSCNLVEMDTASQFESDLLNKSSFGPELTQPYELLHHAFEARALEHPDLRAVECDGRWLTYGELNALANSVGCDLAALGVGVGSRVAVVMSRCLEFPIGLLATLKVGAAMMPLDVAFPAKRVDTMLADAAVTVVVSTKRHEHEIEALALESLSVVNIDMEKDQPKSFVPSARHVATATSEAYIVYTSGSTGQPKGVPVLHRGAVNSIQQHADLLHVKTGTRLFQMMAIGFDGFQADMWQCLSFGGTLVLRSETDLADLHTVDNITCTPTALSLLGDPQLYPRLKVVAVAGEACPTTLRDLWAPHVRFLNLYGPSECAIMSHASPLTKDGPITIGSVIANVNCYVLDDHQRRVPMGVAGEFYLGGVGVSPGYINLPELTQDRFVSDPFARRPGTMYRTGDVGRVLPSGAFEIMGRMDSQVKLKGYRVELDEVANAMMLHPDVASACVVVKDKAYLVGYFTPADVNVGSLRKAVADRLPMYMVPAMWVGLDAMPQNSNGKTNTKALEALEATVEVEPMQSREEVELTQLVATVLKLDVAEISRHSSFVALGGDSITAIYLAAALKTAGWSVSVADILQATRLSDLAGNLDDSVKAKAMVWPDAPLSSHVVHDIASAWPAHETAYATTPEQAFLLRSSIERPSTWILQVPFVGLDAGKMAAAYEQLIQHCEPLRTAFVRASDNSLYHVVNPPSHVVVQHSDKVTSLTEFLTADKARGFDSTEAAFARFTVVSVAQAESVGVLTIHHALYDGWSINLLLADLMDAYHGRPCSQRPSFRHVINFLHALDSSKTVEFWTEYLATAPATACLSNSIFPVATFAAGDLPLCRKVELPRLHSVIQPLGVTMSTVVLLSWSMALHCHAGRDDVVFGQIVANRNLPVDGIEEMLGCVMSTIPCRVGFDSSLSVAERLQLLQSDRVVVQRHSMLDPEDKAAWEHLPAMLFDTEVAFHRSNDKATNELFNKTADAVDRNHAKVYAVEVSVTPTSTGLAISAAFDPLRIDQDTVGRLVSTMVSHLRDWDRHLLQ